MIYQSCVSTFECILRVAMPCHSHLAFVSALATVWIHGRSWQQGSSTQAQFNATNFVSQSVSLGQPIIYISINYRLGAFGFLGGFETDIADAAGYASLNAGYWDQRLAMRWVQENIAAWGGDKERVTIFGESSGASSVAAQMLADRGKVDGLFRAAIMQSGGPAT